MERELFDWDGWDQQDVSSFTFYSVELKKEIGPHQVGDYFSNATIDFDKGFLQLYRSETEFYDYNLGLVVLP